MLNPLEAAGTVVADVAVAGEDVAVQVTFILQQLASLPPSGQVSDQSPGTTFVLEPLTPFSLAIVATAVVDSEFNASPSGQGAANDGTAPAGEALAAPDGEALAEVDAGGGDETEGMPVGATGDNAADTDVLNRFLAGLDDAWRWGPTGPPETGGGGEGAWVGARLGYVLAERLGLDHLPGEAAGLETARVLWQATESAGEAVGGLLGAVETQPTAHAWVGPIADAVRPLVRGNLAAMGAVLKEWRGWRQPGEAAPAKVRPADRPLPAGMKEGGADSGASGGNGVPAVDAVFGSGFRWSWWEERDATGEGGRRLVEVAAALVSCAFAPSGESWRHSADRARRRDLPPDSPRRS